MIIGVLLALIGAGIGFSMLGVSVDTAIQQTTQYTGFVCSSIFICAGFLAINNQLGLQSTNESNATVAEDLSRIRAHLDDQRKEREDIIKAEKSKKTREEAEAKDMVRKQAIKSMEDLLADPVIKEQSDSMRRFYGENVQRDFLKERLQELGISPDDPTA